MEYSTQMEAARKGIITKELAYVAKNEGMDEKELLGLVACGQAIIPANKRHTCIKPSGIGNKLRTKINVNLGTSRDCTDLEMEMEKVKSAVELGAEAIMDLSSFGDTQKFRRKLTSECPAVIGTVPIYDAVVYYHKALKEITAREWIDVVRMHAEDGVDFMTIHCGINKETAGKFKRNKRLTNIVSRGGSIIFAWMEMTGEENPFFEYYDEILDICREYDVTMSLGDACRPGCLKDASDISQKVLTNSLRQMIDDGLVYRHDYQEQPPRVEYGLTGLGTEMLPIVNALADFGNYYKSVTTLRS